MDNKAFDVVALGELLVDFTQNGLSEQGNLLFEANPGGAPANVLAMLRKLGKRCAFIGKVGADSFGDMLVRTVEEAALEAEREFGAEEGRTLLMAAVESPRGALNAHDICLASDRLFGVALSGGDYRKCMQVRPTPSGIELLAARGHLLMAARAAGVQCFDTVFTDLEDEEGFLAEVRLDIEMGFDGKSLISPRQIPIVHRMMTPSRQEIAQAEAIVRAFRENAARGVGVFTLNGKMIDVAFVPGAQRVLRLAKASGVYDGEL